MLPLPKGCEQADITNEAAMLFAKGDMDGAVQLVLKVAERRLKCAYFKQVCAWYFDTREDSVLDLSSGVKDLRHALLIEKAETITQAQKATQTDTIPDTTNNSGRQPGDRNPTPESTKPDKPKSPLGSQSTSGKNPPAGNSIIPQTPRKTVAQSKGNTDSHWPS